MASKSKKGYLNAGFDKIVNLVLAIIPVTSIVLGIITRVLRGKFIGAILNFFVAPLFWIIDIITVADKNNLTFLA